MRGLGWGGEEASARPGAGLSLLPAWLPRLGHCFGTDVREQTHSWNWPAQATQGFFPPPPSSSPVPTPALLFFPSSCKTKTLLLSRVQELQPNGRSRRGRLQGWDTGAA